MNKLPTLFACSGIRRSGVYVSNSRSDLCHPAFLRKSRIQQNCGNVRGIGYFTLSLRRHQSFLLKKIYGTDCHRRHFVFGHDDVIQPGNREDADWNCL